MDMLLKTRRHVFAHANRWAFRVATILLFFAPTAIHSAVPIPPKPENYLSDQGAVFPPDAAQRIEHALKTCARNFDVHIYVVTVPTLNVMPSRVDAKLTELLSAIREEWLQGKVGAIIAFDVEAEQAMLGESEETRNAFSAVSLHLVFADPQIQGGVKRRARERLEATTLAMIQHLSDLRAQEYEDARKQRSANLLFAGIAGAVVLSALIGLFLANRGKAKSAIQRSAATR